MTHNEYDILIAKLENRSKSTLREKRNQYSSFDDPLYNFEVGSGIMGLPKAYVCWGYMTKHLAALRNMIDCNNFNDLDDVLEKCQDVINYIKILWVIANEEHDNNHCNVVDAKESN